jgi:hypothetical protein
LNKWNVVTYSYSIERFETSWALMHDEYGVNHRAITYVKNTWLVHKEKFVSDMPTDFYILEARQRPELKELILF